MAKQTQTPVQPAFRPLEKEFKSNTFIFNEVRREGLVAIYSQTDPDSGRIVGYEVFEVQELPEQWVGPKKYHQEPRECVPGNSTWGRLGFTCQTLEQCEPFFQKLVTQLANRVKKSDI